MVLAIILILSCIVVFGLFVVRNNQRYLNAMNIAEREYFASRPNGETDPKDPDFITMRVTAGMSEGQVEKRMAASHRSLRHLYQHDPEWPGFINIYEFRYGPRFGSVCRDPRYLLQEVFWVYFDVSGNAQAIRRFLYRDREAISPLSVDLKTMKVEEGLAAFSPEIQATRPAY